MNQKKSATAAKLEITHPIYLDTPMLISFLATLDDGVYFSSEVAEKLGSTRKNAGQIEGSVKTPGLVSLLGLSLSTSGKYSRDSGSDQSTESKFVRQHTAASLFNRLRSRLHEEEIVVKIESKNDLLRVNPGTIVEVSGEFSHGPIVQLVQLMKNIWPFTQLDANGTLELQRSQPRNKKMTPEQTLQRDALEQEERERLATLESNKRTMKIVELFDQDATSSPIVDIILQRPDFSALVAAGREFFTDDVVAALLDGTFTLIGKVSAVDSSEDGEVNVIRRGAMGAFAEAIMVPMVEEVRDNFSQHGVGMQLPDVKLQGPHMQIIPLAIFV